MSVTIDSLLQEARLLPGGADPVARLDAEVLLGHALGRPRTFLRAQPEYCPEKQVVERFTSLLTRRRSGEPLAYIVGEREFWSLPLRLNRHTLIPRPETESLVEQALARIPADAGWTIADLGTGSGAIALALGRERPHCRVIATDINEQALAAACANAANLGIGNVEFRRGAWCEPLNGIACEIIVSNPPYIAAGDAHLEAPDMQFEPRAALVSGPTGLEALETIIADAPAHLKAGGGLLLEHGFDQRESVAAALAKRGYKGICCYRDLAGQDRVTAATPAE
ncbi:MAG TPA: peptide chain release factor N(5)-glutamine methyltransferase [Gammaproteobacteria bacterium]|nr:peptide chain release factor N(5)-glutamine methyltransferase [Gammaproteobacteria bacterium]